MYLKVCSIGTIGTLGAFYWHSIGTRNDHKGKDYVVLRNIRGVVKVYRVRSDGALKGLRRYPKAFDA
jgi:hypothetical protein